MLPRTTSPCRQFLRDEESMESLRGGPAEDVGWKNVSGDVFRRAPHTQLLAALLGTGYQLAALVFATIIAAFAGSLYADHRTQHTHNTPCTLKSHP